MMTKSNPTITSVNIEGIVYFQLIDSKENYFSKGRVKRIIERYRSLFKNKDLLLIESDINYISLSEFIEKINGALLKISAPALKIDQSVQNYIHQNRYEIEEHQIAGSTIKNFDSRWNSEIVQFIEVINKEIERPLKAKQLQASFYLTTMKKAANFSVPGAGKTAMAYGSFAYLSSKKINKVRQLLVISPINAFEAWRTEYIEVFGDKRNLNYLNLQDVKYKNNGQVRMDWAKSDLIVLNYEALEGKIDILNELIDEQTMLVFDEAHRIKGINGRRANAAMSIGHRCVYKYILTGTPIPNGYQDIYNMLNLMYRQEYESFFGWEVNELKSPNVNQINEKISPFFWRTTKKDLMVPSAEPDKLIIVSPTKEQKKLVEAIYENEKNVLSLYLRLLQASTNPSLLLKKLEYKDLGVLKEEIELTYFNALTKDEQDVAKKNVYEKLNVNNMTSTKFEKGIQLVKKLVSENKKVIVWAMFVDTMKKIEKELFNEQIDVSLIYGATSKDHRIDMINDFRNGSTQVLISNPNTLGESISLHQSVHDAVYFEFNFNLTFMLQSRDRIHRLGLRPEQYTRYHYLMTDGDRAHRSYIDKVVYERLKQKEETMLNAIEGELLVPEVPDDYLTDIKKIIKNEKSK